MDLDDVPAVASGSAGGIPNDPDAMPAAPDYDTMSFGELLGDANWKAHKAAFDRLANGGEDVDVGAFASMLPKLVKDVNGPAADSFVEALATALEDEVVDAGAVAEVALGPVADKGLTGRQRAAAASARVLKALTTAGQGEPVFAALAKGMSAKAPKLRHVSIQALANVVKELGIHHFNLKQLIKAIVPLFNDTDAKVRKEAMTAVTHCYRFVGAGIEPFLTDVRDVQKQELDRMFAAVSDELAASHGTHKAPAAGRAPGNGAGKPEGLERRSQSPPDMDALAADAYADMPETAIVGRLPGDLLAFTRDKGEKWKDRERRIVGELLPLLASRRLSASGDYTDIVKAIRDFLNDPQLPISSAGFRCAQAMAGSLRVGLAPYARFLVPTLFDKLKEKKPFVIDATKTTIDAMLRYGCVTPDQLHDDFEASCASKLPNHRHAALKWAFERLDKSPEPAAYGRLCAASGLLARLVNDDKLEVREAALDLAAKIVACGCGDRLGGFLAGLDDKQYQRVTNEARPGSAAPAALDAAVLSQSSRPVRSAPASTAARSATARPTAASTNPKTPGAGMPAMTRRQSLVGVSSQAGKAAAPAAAAAGPSAAAAILDEDLFAATLVSPDDGARVLVENLAPIDPAVADAVRNFDAKEWRVRTDAATTIANAAMQMPPEAAGVCAAGFVSVLRQATGWKEGMFQVVNANARALLVLVQAAEGLTAWAAFVAVQGFVARLSEPKSRPVVADLFTAITEQVGPKLIVRLVTAVANEAKNAKLTTEVLEWVGLTVQQFAAPIDARSLVEFLRGHVFEQPNPAVKNAGISVCVALRRRLGARFDAMLGDINPHLRKTYDAEVAKDDCADRAAVPQRRVRDPLELPGSNAARSKAAASAAATTSGAGAVAAAVDGDFPPEDVSAALAAAIKQLNDAKDWKIRAKGLRTIEDAVNGASRTITPAGVTDAFKALKPRLEEPNKNLVADALRVMSLLAEAVVPATGARAGLRGVFQSTVLMMGDQKPALRDEAVKVSNKAVEVVGFEPLCGIIVKAMATDNQASRLALAEMVLAAFRAGQHAAFPPRGMQPLVQPLLKMFVDRNTTVRSLAEASFSYVLSNVGFDIVARAVTSFKPADQNIIGPVLDRVRPIEEPVAPAPARLDRTDMPPPPPQQQQAPQHYQEGPAVAHGARNDEDDVADAPPRRHVDPVRIQEPMPPRARVGMTAADVAAGLRGAPMRAVPQLCLDLDSIMRVDPLAVDERTLDAVLARLLAAFTSEVGADMMAAADALLGTLCSLVTDDRYAAGLTAEDIERLLGTLFQCITTPNAAEAAMGPSLKAVNQCVDAVVRKAAPDTIVAAVFSLVSELQQRDLIECSTYTEKMADLPFRVLIRFNNLDRATSPDALIRAIHGFLFKFPPSRLHARTERPIRIVKQLLNDMRARFGGARCLATTEALVGRNNLVFGYLQMMEEQQQQQQQQQQEAAQQHAASQAAAASPAHAAASRSPAAGTPATRTPSGLERSDAVPRHSTAPGARPVSMGARGVGPEGKYTDALSSMKPNVTASRAGESSPVSLIFAKARKSETSSSALRELYTYMREHPRCPEVEKQLARCSDAFKDYIRKNLDKIAQEQGAEPVC